MTNRVYAGFLLIVGLCLFSLGKANAETITKNPGWGGASLINYNEHDDGYAPGSGAPYWGRTDPYVNDRDGWDSEWRVTVGRR